MGNPSWKPLFRWNNLAKACASARNTDAVTAPLASGARRRREEAAAAAVGAFAAPERTVGRGLRLIERNLFGTEQDVAVAGHGDLLGGDDEAVAFAATPFAG